MMCEQNYNNYNLKIFMSFVLKHKKLFVIDMSFSCLIALIDILFPYLSRWSLRNMLQNNLFNAFFLVMFIFFVLYIIKAILHYLVTVIGHKMGTLIESDMREIIFTHIQTLSFSFFDKNRTGELLSRVTNDLFDIVELAHHVPENILICAITFIGTSIILMMINVYLTVVLILLLIISLCYCLYQRTVMKQTNKDVKVKIGKINSIIENGISGIRTTKAFANEDIENDKFNVVNEMFKSSKIWYYEAMGKFNGSIEATVGIMNVFVLSLGGYFIMKKSMDYIDLVTFTLYISIFITPIRKLTQVMEIYAQGMSGFERFLDVMRTKPDIVDSNNAFVLDNVKGLIKFENVSFKYDDSYILNNVNITINPGETVALVGESGGGKTTFCNLLLRFYDIQKGIISIDGIDIREVTQESLRKNIGIIQQDVFLYTDTILENIRYGNLQATDEEIINASKLAGIHNDILKMPMGYATFVGEKGIKLSGGQKQRISIARVFLKNPKILLLDEATSSLDSVTEQQIQESLNKLVFGKTTIIIAHRLSTIKNVNHIAVIGNNQILEYGTREELLNKNGIYKQFELAQQF